MTRRIFISYEGDDRMQAKGFRLLRFNQNVEVDFFDRQLLDPVQSRDPEYIRRCINERMRGTSVTVVLIGQNTHQSDWVHYEIQRTIEEGKGLLGVRLKDQENAATPSGLAEAGAEVIDWKPDEFNDAIERAAGGPALSGPSIYEERSGGSTRSNGSAAASCGRGVD